MAKTSSLSMLAKSAKARLKCNHYDGMHKSPTPTNFGSYIRQVEEKPKTVQSVVINSYDEMLYKKVCRIIDLGLDKVNPIGELIDKKVFSGLDFEAKQHYISTLNFKYKELKQRYYKEHTTYAVFG